MASFVARLQRHAWATPTVLLAIVVVMAASVARAFTTDPLGSADEPAHLDYALQVWHGHLPLFADGLRNTVPFGAHPPVQWVAQHPPLFYLVLAPIVGPAWDSGHVLVAVMLGRLCSVVFAGLLVPASAWAAARCFPDARRLPSAVGVVVALTGIVVVQGGSIYNDSLYAVLCALAAGVAGAALRSGLGPRLLVGGVLVGAAGMTGRLSFGIWLAAIVVAFLLARRVRLGALRGIGGRIVAGIAPLVAAAAASGWFYLRNREVAGSFSGRPTGWAGHVPREKRSDLQVAVDPEFWRGIYGVFRGALDPLSAVPWLLLVVPVLLAVVAMVLHGVLRRRSLPRGGDALRTALVVAMLAVVTVLFTVAELRYVAGGGGAINRYVLTVVVPVAFLVAAGLVSWGRASAWFLVAWSALAVVPSVSLVTFSGVAMLPHSGAVGTLAFVVSMAALVLALLAFVLAERHRPDGPASRGAGRRSAGRGGSVS